MVADWSTELPFVDVIKSSRPWTSNGWGLPWGGGAPSDLDEYGWIRSIQPNQWGEIAMFSGTGHYPTGAYTMLWEGEGTFEFRPSNVAVTPTGPGRAIVDIPAGLNGIYLRQFTTNATNRMRNIRLLMPGHEATYQQAPFNPSFLDNLRPFNSLRFLWWMRTSSTTAPGAMANWADRPRLSHAFFTYVGVPLELMIDLANELDVDPWFTLPHNATDSHFSSFATMVRDRLEPGRRAYIEYSNETWNAVYPQMQYTMQQGLALGLSTSGFQAGLRYHGRRAVQMFRIWEAVFGGRDRLIRVLAAQHNNTWTGGQVIDQARIENGGSLVGMADAFAIAPYFGCVQQLTGWPGGAAQVIAMTEDEILDRCVAELRGETTQLLTINAATASSAGLPLIAYEGGQHMVGIGSENGNDALTAKLTQVNRNQRLEAIYTEYLTLWRQIGGQQFENFWSVSPNSRSGSFGAKEWQDQDPALAPKYRALIAAAS